MDPEEPDSPKNRKMNTIASLRLNIEEAMAGRTWLLLPEGFRDRACGGSYPLPSRRTEIQRLVAIPIRDQHKMDSGCIYLRRALKEWTCRQGRKSSALLDLARREDSIQWAQTNFNRRMKNLKEEAKNAVDEVRREAEKAVASLTDLFSIGRQGIDGQMRAHINGTEWQGERIDSKAFRDCFRMVTQAVKGLGLPSDQRSKATEAVMEEVAASIRDTQETVALAPGSDPEVEN